MPDSPIVTRFRELFSGSREAVAAVLGDGGATYYTTMIGNAWQIDSHVERCRKMARLLELSGTQRVLDVGCGHGLAVCLLEAFGAAESVGIELADTKVPAAQKLAANLGCTRTRFDHYDGGKLPYPDSSFDGVAISAAMSHVNDIEATLADMARVLKPTGRLYIFEDNNALWTGYAAAIHPQWRHAETGEVTGGGKAQPGWVPYRERRARMIREWFPALDAARVEEYALATKGLVRDEIRAAVEGAIAGNPISVNKPFLYYAPDTGEAMEYPFTPPMLRDMTAKHFTDVRLHSAWTGPWRGAKGMAKLAMRTLGGIFPPFAWRTQGAFVVSARKA